MLSDVGIRIAGHTITNVQILGVAALLLGIAALLLLFKRERVTLLRKSIVTEELTFHLDRIAQSLERLADHNSYSVMRQAAQDAAHAPAPKETVAEVVQEPPKERRAAPAAPRRVAYSVFGR